MKLSEKIYALRTKNNMTQGELADIAGVSGAAVSAWETGIREPKMAPIRRICENFGVDIRTFMDERNEVFEARQPGQNECPASDGEAPMLDDKTVLITGGTGSFGHHFVEYVLAHYRPKKLIIYSRDEFKQFNMQNEYREFKTVLRFFIGDVRDADRLRRALHGVDYVIHAAALKQVPACEYNPLEAVKTNINGACNVIDACLDTGVKKVVALSTDKSVNPINLYGSTKMVSDKLFSAANAYSGENGTRFSVVRYGNVAGSRGSVIPFFQNIIDQGGDSLPITDHRMTRFWISLEEGVKLVIKALEESRGGETFISKIPSFKITDLAQAMLPGCQMPEVGIREGEKLHEVMVPAEDSGRTYEYEEHYIIYPNYDWWKKSNLIPGGKRVEPGFTYNSGTNRQWLSVDDIRRLLKTDLDRH